ncbi:MAG: hypothetical protein JW874_00105 [Spirochaetales bacterium]|nr:hypothetical protein [Spirochaetales bacterium]
MTTTNTGNSVIRKGMKAAIAAGMVLVVLVFGACASQGGAKGGTGGGPYKKEVKAALDARDFVLAFAYYALAGESERVTALRDVEGWSDDEFWLVLDNAIMKLMLMSTDEMTAKMDKDPMGALNSGRKYEAAQNRLKNIRRGLKVSDVLKNAPQ